MNIDFDGLQADLIAAFTRFNRDDLHAEVMSPWLELRAELSSIPVAA